MIIAVQRPPIWIGNRDMGQRWSKEGRSSEVIALIGVVTLRLLGGLRSTVRAWREQGWRCCQSSSLVELGV